MLLGPLQGCIRLIAASRLLCRDIEDNVSSVFIVISSVHALAFDGRPVNK